MHTEPWWADKVSPEYLPLVTLALEVGKYQLEQFRKPSLAVETKSSAQDLVTAVDKACDAMIVKRLNVLFPEDLVLSEEGNHTLATDKRQWIVDPLDGTTNFASGLPIFAISIALWHRSVPIFGLVFVPMLNELAVAERNLGAYLNNQRLQVSQETDLGACVLGTGFPYDRKTARNCNAQNMATLIPQVRGIRRMGAAAYDLTLVAAGYLDGFWELRLSIWDIAAAKLFLMEAGATWYETQAGGLYNIICGNQNLVTQIKNLVDLEN